MPLDHISLSDIVTRGIGVKHSGFHVGDQPLRKRSEWRGKVAKPAACELRKRATRCLTLRRDTSKFNIVTHRYIAWRYIWTPLGSLISVLFKFPILFSICLKVLCGVTVSGSSALACVGSITENRFIVGLVRGKRCWLGATDEGHEGRWTWVNGEPFKYSSWLPGQPDNAGGREHYLEVLPQEKRKPSFGRGGKRTLEVSKKSREWNDLPSHYALQGFICEWDK